MSNKIDEQVHKLREGYASVLEDEEEEQLSFLDELNKLLQLIFNDSSADIYTILKPQELENWKKRKVRRQLKRVFGFLFQREFLYFALLATITGFLVTEALPFYATAGAITGKTYLKAILTEISFIFLSGYRSVGHVQTALVSVLRASIFALMLFVISSEVMLEGTKNISKIDNIANRIVRLERQIEKTEEDIERYRKINWPRNMTTSIRKREQLEEEVQKLRARQETEGAAEELSAILQYKMYGKAVFRLILMFISVLITRRIFRF
jgi:hypothetical protein